MENHEKAVTTFVSVLNHKDYGKLDTAMAPDFHRYAPDQTVGSLAEMKELIRQIHTAYPDFHIELHESAYKGDIGFVRWTATGTHSGRSFETSGATMFRFGNGKITEELVYYDTRAMQATLGVEAIPHAR